MTGHTDAGMRTFGQESHDASAQAGASPTDDYARLRRAQYRRSSRRRREALRTGTWRPIMAADVAFEHVARMRGWGMSVRAIAAAAGLGESTVSPLYWPGHGSRRTFVLPSTVDALAMVTTPLQAPPWAHIDSAGTRRRIEALQVVGWSQQEVATRLGISRQAVAQMKRAALVTVANAVRVRDVYDELCMKPGTDRRTRRWATRMGYAPPLAWDDESIDDPAAQPHGSGWRPGHLDLDEFMRLIRYGETAERAVARLGITPKAVERAAYRAEPIRRDVLRALRPTDGRATA